MGLLLIHQIFWLLFNTLAADEKYPVLNRDNLTLPIQMQLFQKQETFSKFFAACLKYRLIFLTFWNKRWPSQLFYFGNYGLSKRGQINV